MGVEQAHSPFAWNLAPGSGNAVCIEGTSCMAARTKVSPACPPTRRKLEGELCDLCLCDVCVAPGTLVSGSNWSPSFNPGSQAPVQIARDEVLVGGWPPPVRNELGRRCRGRVERSRRTRQLAGRCIRLNERRSGGLSPQVSATTPGAEKTGETSCRLCPWVAQCPVLGRTLVRGTMSC